MTSDAGPPSGSPFVSLLHTGRVDKVDLLFMIDNSASMGDKQALLAQAVPDMINRLVSPRCVDGNNAPTGATAAVDGTCPAGSKAEFPPVSDMHIGVVSSSLGGRGGDVCPSSGSGSQNPANPSLSAHNDDRGELLGRGGVASDPTVENQVLDAMPDNFLSWFPATASNAGKMPPPTAPITSASTLIGDFTQLVAGVHEHVCGMEAQNEAWYRFLIQPDPFDSIAVNGGRAAFNGHDNTILAQRAAFLRPDSLVAVIVVTDENEEVANPLAIGGQGWAFETQSFPGSPNGTAPQGTIECSRFDVNNPATTGPNDPNCTSCAFISLDPNFAARCPKDGANGSNGYLDPNDDNINVRFFQQKRRFGLFAGYPTSRYVRGLTSPYVPDSNTGHEVDSSGNYIGDQDTNANCINPLFATNLPTSDASELCNLQRGPRTPDLIYYAAIAGVPHQLLQQDPANPDSPQKDTLSAADWTLITGQDPEHYDFRGIDFHMVESIDPRTTNTGGWANSSSCPPGPLGAPAAGCDPVNGGEWQTNKQDLQFACIFDLRPQFNNQGKDCTNPKYSGACDCATGALNASTQLCQGTTQIYGKAYPSQREMIIAHAMSQRSAQNGGQGVVSSLCPIHVTPANGDNPPDPLFGYRPAVDAIVNRFRPSLTPSQCAPQGLPVDACGVSACRVYVSLVAQADPNNPGLCKSPGTACSTVPGLQAPSDAVLAGQFCDEQERQFKANGGFADPATIPTCEVTQLRLSPAGGSCPPGSPASDFDATGSCAASSDPGWCYVTGPGAGSCAQAILFSSGLPPHGASTALVCPAH
jgi:hypothetical protein